jgi:protein-disulfide isomerase-like protein with CxxC motif
MGVTGFPTLLISRDGELEILANGYMKYDPLDKLMEKAPAD